MRCLVLAFIVLSCAIFAPGALAQRRRGGDTAAVDAQLELDAGAPRRVRLSLVARDDVEVTADLRLLRLEVRPIGRGRALPCDAPPRPGRGLPDTRRMRAGEVWTDTFDVRMFCWGRALAALDAGAELGGSLGTARIGGARRSAGGSRFRAVALPFTPVPARAPTSPAPVGDVRVVLSGADAASGAHLSFHVAVRASRPVRAWVRPDRLRFRVRTPSGETHLCAMDRAEGAPIPDLFARVGTRSGPAYSLDARAYCGVDVFAHAGIYEVTPLLDLDVDGSDYRMDTPLGTFEGAAALVRVRAEAAP